MKHFFIVIFLLFLNTDTYAKNLNKLKTSYGVLNPARGWDGGGAPESPQHPGLKSEVFYENKDLNFEKYKNFIKVATKNNSNSQNESKQNRTLKISQNFQEYIKSKTSKWTLMVYISGDNDLEEYVVKDIEEELALIGSTDKVNVVALADRIKGYDKSRGDWKHTLLFHVTKGMKATKENAVADLGEKNFGDPKTLLEFVNWSKENFPAEKYALFMWGHGWNWHPEGTMEDQSNNDSLAPHEIKSILPKLGKFEMVAFDGCDMASIEVDTLWNNYARTIVHSQEYVEWDGIEYDVVIKELNKNPDITAVQLAKITNRSAGLNKEKTGSAVVLDDRFNILLKEINDWSVLLKKYLKDNKKKYQKAFRKTRHFYEEPEYNKDLYDLVLRIEKTVIQKDLKLKCKSLRKAIKNVIIDEWHTKSYSGANGISISIPDSKNEYKNYYKTLDFSKITQWDEFLEAFYSFK